MGMLKLPIPLNSSPDFPVVQYADDTLVIMEGDPNQLIFLKSILNSFAESTGLRVNYRKTMMLPINMTEDRLDHLARTFGCSKGSLPFVYLGLPLGLTKPRVQDFLPLVNKCERRLASVSTFLSQAGRLELTNAVFTALPTFYMCSLAIPKTVIKQIDKYRKHCLWRGSDVNGRGQPKAAWTLICTPKDQGGLGVINIEDQNKALLLKNLHKFFNRAQIPWVSIIWEKHYPNGKLPGTVNKGSFWWRDNLKNLQEFKQMVQIQIKNGETCLFWQDNWGQHCLKNRYPELLSFVKNKSISVAAAWAQQDMTQMFHLPVSEIAYNQFQTVNQELAQIQLTNEQDIWKYQWGNVFYSSNAYKIIAGHSQHHPRWIWNSFCQPKHRVFFWLLLRDRLSSRNILRRKNMLLQSYNCVLWPTNIEENSSSSFLAM